jgi:hypothetical protein
MSKPLHILEIAFWTFLAIILLLLVFAIVAGFAFDLISPHLGPSNIPAWWLIGGVMGGILLALGALWWWWGRVMKDREEARRYADGEGSKRP